jgi:hypothetical protein
MSRISFIMSCKAMVRYNPQRQLRLRPTDWPIGQRKTALRSYQHRASRCQCVVANGVLVYPRQAVALERWHIATNQRLDARITGFRQ